MNKKRLVFLCISLLFLVIFAGCQNGTAEPEEMNNSEPDADVVVELTAVNYSFSQDTITVTKGQTVRIELTSTEGRHDWVVDEFDAATDIVSGGDTATVVFEADEAGEFEYYCSVSNHRAQGMVGTLFVEE